MKPPLFRYVGLFDFSPHSRRIQEFWKGVICVAEGVRFADFISFFLRVGHFDFLPRPGADPGFLEGGFRCVEGGSFVDFISIFSDIPSK